MVSLHLKIVVCHQHIERLKAGQESTGCGRVHDVKSECSLTYLADMLTKWGVGDHLTQEVEVCCHQRHDSTADEHGHILLVSQSHVLHTPEFS